MKIRVTGVLLVMLSGLVGCSGALNTSPAKINAAKEFQKLKQLEGSWRSRSPVDGSHEQVTYNVTSGGNALKETLFPGTDNEMLSVYYVENNNLLMTHYCMLSNQPMLRALRSQDNTVLFDYVPTPGINAHSDEHMHQLKLVFAGPDRLIQQWTSYKDGKPDHTKTIDLERVN